jgi:eukaryotic-like serine/threonine-protein kinase
MTTERYQLLKALFERASEMNLSERMSYLDSSCAGDPELREELQSLLNCNDDERNQILDKPLTVLAPDLAFQDESDILGELVGPYRLKRLIGQGGMGVVYEAWREDGQYRQRVALKLIRRNATSELLVRRFRQERQILAALSHPHIARLLEGGVTSGGQPYFVMEYVEGLPIKEYCETNNLSLRERVTLFRDVCSAVQYAHQNLIVHRDLKPSNILVTDDGEVKLLDFGIAKLLHEEQEVLPSATRTDVLLMTPKYASPEQMRRAQVTTVSDVYSLGVILYELLTSRYPYAEEDGLLFEMEQMICQQDPPKPSSVVARPDKAGARRASDPAHSATSVEPHLSPEIRSRQLRGDLDNIVLKAIAKELSSRYISAEALSEDIRRYLSGEPVIAHPPTVVYRSKKFISRHRAAVASVLMIVLSLGLGIIAASEQALRAERERERAERRFRDVRQLAHSLLFDFHNAIEKLPGSTPIRKMLVQRALEYLDGLAREAGDDSGLKLELANAYAQVGKLQWARYYAHLGDLEGAWRSQQKALAIREILLARDDKNKQARIDLSASFMAIGDLQVARGDLTAALASYRKAAGLRQELVTSNPSSSIRKALAVSYQRIGDTLGNPNFPNLGDVKSALENFRKMQEMFEKLASEAPADSEARHSVAIGFEKMGDVLAGSGDLAGSLKFYRKELAEDQRIVSSDPSNVLFARDLYVPYEKIGMTLVKTGDLTEAVQNYGEALKICERLAAVDPENVGARNDLINVLTLLATATAKENHMADARRYQLKSLNLQKALADRPGATGSDLNGYAWQLLTCEPADLRDPTIARRYAERAAAVTDRKDPTILDTLALALHLTGDDRVAVQAEEAALALTPASSIGRTEFEEHVEQYRSAMSKAR